MGNFLGEIRMVGFNFTPVGWLLCNGQTLPISSYQALFARLGQDWNCRWRGTNPRNGCISGLVLKWSPRTRFS